MTQVRLQLSFVGAQPSELLACALNAGMLPTAAPTGIKADGAQAQPRSPVELAASHDDLHISWGREVLFTSSRRHDSTDIQWAQFDLHPTALLDALGDWPFEACTTRSIDPTWWPGYRSIHGWALLLKGEGHRLVSERVMDRGPWRRLYDGGKHLTLLQLHDLSAAADDALRQARPGHALLAPVWLGGHYASRLWTFRGAARDYKPTFYDSATSTSIVLVQEREVMAKEMAIAAATRVHQIFPEPVKQVAFVYFDEATARRQLPDLWMHGLEVRVMTGSGERRIDLEYSAPAPPEPPDWVKQQEH